MKELGVKIRLFPGKSLRRDNDYGINILSTVNLMHAR